MRQVLCLATKQYSQTRFEKDIQYIHQFFSEHEVTSERGVTADHFHDYFAPGSSWDIVHLGLFVDKENQRMLFDSQSGTGEIDFLRVEAVGGMIKQCGAALVVITTCDSLRFGEQLARFTNVIAGHQAITPGAAQSWAKVFYQALSYREPLSQAFYKRRTRLTRSHPDGSQGHLLSSRKCCLNLDSVHRNMNQLWFSGGSCRKSPSHLQNSSPLGCRPLHLDACSSSRCLMGLVHCLLLA